MQGSGTAHDRRRIPFGRPALIRRMDDVLSLDGDNRQNQGPGEPADAEPTVVSVPIATSKPKPQPKPQSKPQPQRAHASSSGSNLFADRRIPSAANRKPKDASTDGSPSPEGDNLSRHAGHSHGHSQNRNHRRERGRRSIIIMYVTAGLLVAAAVAAYVATRAPAGSPTSAAGSAAAQRHRDQTDHTHDGSTAPGKTSPSPNAPGAVISPPAGGPSAAAGPAPGDPQPLGWWDLDYDSGMTAGDGVGHHNGVTENITWIGGAAEFDGTNSQIEVPEPVVDTAPGASFTIAAWVDLTSDTASASVVSQDTTVDSGFSLEYDQSDNCWAFARHSANTASAPVDRALATGVPALNTWTALIGVFDGGTGQLQIYVDGQLQGAASDPTPFAATGNLVFGRSIAGSIDGAYFPGLIGDVQVFNQALTQPEAESLSGY
jgi:hypothetical protein